MFALFMALWGVVVLVALACIFWKSCGGRWVHALGQHRRRKAQRRSRLNATVTERDGVDLPDLTPLPSPKRDESDPPKKKLMALGRGSLGVEKWVGEKQGGESSWVARLRSIGHGGKDRPNLRIIINPAELTGDSESSPREKPPTSAWSVSPLATTTGTRRLPWTTNPP